MFVDTGDAFPLPDIVTATCEKSSYPRDRSSFQQRSADSRSRTDVTLFNNSGNVVATNEIGKIARRAEIMSTGLRRATISSPPPCKYRRRASTTAQLTATSGARATALSRFTSRGQRESRRRKSQHARIRGAGDNVKIGRSFNHRSGRYAIMVFPRAGSVAARFRRGESASRSNFGTLTNEQRQSDRSNVTGKNPQIQARRDESRAVELKESAIVSDSSVRELHSVVRGKNTPPRRSDRGIVPDPVAMLSRSKKTASPTFAVPNPFDFPTSDTAV